MADVRLSIAIQTHPDRDQLACALIDEIGEGELVCDPDPDGRPNPWRCYRHALEVTPADATHAAIVQDDVTLCAYFREALYAAVEARPGHVLVLFHGGQPRETIGALNYALRVGEPWIRMRIRRWLPVVATVYPIEVVAAVLGWLEDAQLDPRLRSDDEIMGRAIRSVGAPVLATVPSLVEHNDRIPSMIGKRHRGGRDPARVAYRFQTGDPRQIDWSAGPH